MRAKLRPLFPALITLVVALLAMAVYMQGPINGEFNHFFLPSKMFGVPAELREHGITEMYAGKDETGWDGQFYYYIANDPFAQKDTAAHIDANAYRYQRVGLSLLANLASKLTFRSWVSPALYYATSLALVVIACGMAGFFFRRHNISPYIALIWALGFGTQVTQLNGLPDAAADALLIIALLSLWRGHVWLYIAAASFAALSREVYVLVPACFGLGLLLIQWHRRNLFRWRGFCELLRKAWPHAVPMLVVLAWQSFLRWKFGVTASSQAAGILGWPLQDIASYWWAGVKGNHPLVGLGGDAYGEALGISCFVILIVLSAFALRPLLRWPLVKEQEFSFGLAIAGTLLIALYLCFGPTVMMHHTGYLKASNLFLFLLPFALALGGKRLNKPSLALLLFLSAYGVVLMWNRISAAPYYPPRTVSYVPSEPACVTDHRARLRPQSLELSLAHKSFLKRMFGEKTVVVDMEITNLSKETFAPYIGKGGVDASYHWLKAGTKEMVLDGKRSPLEGPLKPGERAIVPVTISFPKARGEYILRLSLVQEGCDWFYHTAPDSAFDIPFTIR